jgi:hypothetical protein
MTVSNLTEPLTDGHDDAQEIAMFSGKRRRPRFHTPQMRSAFIRAVSLKGGRL